MTRITLNALWYIIDEQIRKWTEIKNLKEIVKSRSKQMLNQMKNHTNSLLRETRNAIPPSQKDIRKEIVNKTQKCIIKTET